MISIGEPIAVDERLESYRRNRRHAVAGLTPTLQEQLEGLIVPSAAPDLRHATSDPGQGSLHN
jgi:hypothetical protein